MTAFVHVKVLSGYSYVRADQVTAVAATETAKCVIYIAGGASLPCTEPAKDVIARIEAAVAGAAQRETA